MRQDEAARLRRGTEHSPYGLISQHEAMVYARDADGRLGIQSAVLLEGAAASIEIPDFDVALAFAAIYEGLDFGSERMASMTGDV